MLPFHDERVGHDRPRQLKVLDRQGPHVAIRQTVHVHLDAAADPHATGLPAVEQGKLTALQPDWLARSGGALRKGLRCPTALHVSRRGAPR